MHIRLLILLLSNLFVAQALTVQDALPFPASGEDEVDGTEIPEVAVFKVQVFQRAVLNKK